MIIISRSFHPDQNNQVAMIWVVSLGKLTEPKLRLTFTSVSQPKKKVDNPWSEASRPAGPPEA